MDVLYTNEARLVLWGLCVRGVALVFAISFASLSTQVAEWPGAAGIAPIAARLRQYTRVYYPELVGLPRSRLPVVPTSAGAAGATGGRDLRAGGPVRRRGGAGAGAGADASASASGGTPAPATPSSSAPRRPGLARKLSLYVRRFASRPTLLWVTGASDGAIVWHARVGCLLSLAAFVGGYTPGATTALFAAVWLLYLSIDVAFGLAYPWDSLLLSAGFLLVFMPPLQPLLGVVWSGASAPASSVSAPAALASAGCVALPDPQLCFLVRYLLARVLLGFGKLKFVGSGGKHHCYIRGFLISQPMPTKFGWLAHHLPLPVHKALLAGMFVVEILMPPLFFFGGTARFVAAASAALLMVSVGTRRCAAAASAPLPPRRCPHAAV